VPKDILGSRRNEKPTLQRRIRPDESSIKRAAARTCGRKRSEAEMLQRRSSSMGSASYPNGCQRLMRPPRCKIFSHAARPRTAGEIGTKPPELA